MADPDLGRLVFTWAADHQGTVIGAVSGLAAACIGLGTALAQYRRLLADVRKLSSNIEGLCDLCLQLHAHLSSDPARNLLGEIKPRQTPVRLRIAQADPSDSTG